MHSSDIDQISGLTRIEQTTNDEMNELLVELTHAVYPHAKAYPGAFTLEQWINTSPEDAFEQLSQAAFIEQYSYSYRSAKQLDDSRWQFNDALTKKTLTCQLTTHSNTKIIDMLWRDTSTQALIRHDSLRIINAKESIQKAGCIILFTSSGPVAQTATNHENQSLETMAIDKTWKASCAQRKIELHNIQCLLENPNSHNESFE